MLPWLAGVLLASPQFGVAQEVVLMAPSNLNLEVVDPADSTQLRLRWVNGGVSGVQQAGMAAFESYDVRGGAVPTGDLAAWWASAVPVPGVPTPGGYLSHGQVVVTGLPPGQMVLVGIRGRYGSFTSDLVCMVGNTPVDPAPPASVNLQAGEATDVSFALTWTAPGDDGSGPGHATRYDLRWSAGDAGDDPSSWFAAATPLDGAPPPYESGSTQNWILQDLAPSTRYTVGLRASDEALQWGPVSIASAVTLAPKPESEVKHCLGAARGAGMGLALALALLVPRRR